MTKIQQFIILIFISFGSFGHAQDVHYSQYSFAPSLLSPALSHNFDSEFQGGAIYRNQWASVPVRYSSFLGYFDKKILKSFAGNAIAYGVHFQYDKAGDAGMSLMKVQFNGAISRPLSPLLSLSLGFGVGYGSRQFSPEKLSFGSQFTDQYRPTTASGEVFNETSVGFLDLAVGLNAHINVKNKHKGNLGFSLSHINQPKVSFLGADASLFPSMQVYALGNFFLSEKTDVLINTIYRRQGVYNEAVISTGLKYYLNKEINKTLAVSFLAGTRLGDAFFPEFHIYFKNWTGGLSYDINNSDFKVATAGKGGPEFSIKYIANQIVPPKKVKICPIF